MVKVGLARLKSASGDTEGAVKTLEDAARISPKPAKLYYYLGQTHEKAGNLQGAVDAYRKALEKLLDH
jgi:Flp pilus assembly protein TadD